MIKAAGIHLVSRARDSTRPWTAHPDFCFKCTSDPLPDWHHDPLSKTGDPLSTREWGKPADADSTGLSGLESRKIPVG